MEVSVYAPEATVPMAQPPAPLEAMALNGRQALGGGSRNVRRVAIYHSENAFPMPHQVANRAAVCAWCSRQRRRVQTHQVGGQLFATPHIQDRGNLVFCDSTKVLGIQPPGGVGSDQIELARAAQRLEVSIAADGTHIQRSHVVWHFSKGVVRQKHALGAV